MNAREALTVLDFAADNRYTRVPAALATLRACVEALEAWDQYLSEKEKGPHKWGNFYTPREQSLIEQLRDALLKGETK